MRILLAFDGSSCSEVARDLVASADWPEGTLVRAIAVLEHGPALFGVPWLAVTPIESAEIEAAIAGDLERSLEAAAAGLAAPGREVRHELIRGRPASAIVEDARRFGPDLIVLGSRGHGTLDAMLLGSTSAEVVDHAPCPVLVARRREVRRIVVGEDGSAGAGAAVDLLAAWPVWRGLPVSVVSVADVALPWDAGIAPGVYGPMLESYSEARDETSRMHAAMAARTAERLSAAGLPAEPKTREGDPAAQLLRASDEDRADLVVVGCRGRTGLARLILGSVARNVLIHARCSVLVVHQPAAPAA